jgi:hypothetical protein
MHEGGICARAKDSFTIKVPAITRRKMGAMKNRVILFIVLFAAFAAIAAIAAVSAGRETAKAILEDAVHWFQYFAGPIRRG